MPTFGSAFAGIGGFELGLERAGWECKWQIENDKFCNKILKKVWPDVKRYGNIEEVNTEELKAVDLICGGFPCQDLSVAGKRGGLSGERSGLFWELVRMARELQPRWLLIENVPGFLSSNEGEDFALAIETLAECGYGLAWRVLDSQYFGVPQRRRRVFIVGYLGAMCPPEILFESEGSEGDTAEGGKARQRITSSPEGISGAVSAKWLKGSGGPAGDEAYNLIYHSKGSDFDVREYEGICPTVTERWGTGEGNVPYVGEEADPNGVREASGLPRRVGLPMPKALTFADREHSCDAILDEKYGTLQAHPQSETSNIQKGVMVFDWQSGGDVRHNVSEKHTSALHKSQTPAVLTEQSEGVACDCPDSPQYRALGNAVTVQVAEWIGRRILEYERRYND